MLMIRLQRTGRTNDPSFRVVLTDKRNSPKSRNFVEILGTYDVKGGKTSFNAEKIKHWISKGAKLSPTMHNFMVSEKIISGKKINVLPKKSPIKKEGSEISVEAKVETPAVEAPVSEATAETPAN